MDQMGKMNNPNYEAITEEEVFINQNYLLENSHD